MRSISSRENDSMAIVLIGHLTTSPRLYTRKECVFCLIPMITSMLVATRAHKCESMVDFEARIAGALFAMVNISSLVAYPTLREEICVAVFENEPLLAAILAVVVEPRKDDLHIYYAFGILSNLMHTHKLENVLKVVETPGLLDTLKVQIKTDSDVIENAPEYLLANICAHGPPAIEKIIDSGILEILTDDQIYAPKENLNDLPYSNVYKAFVNIMSMASSGKQFKYCMENKFVELMMSDFGLPRAGNRYNDRVKSVWKSFTAAGKTDLSDAERQAFLNAFNQFEEKEKIDEWVNKEDQDELLSLLSNDTTGGV
jgi:hypothetical protein